MSVIRICMVLLVAAVLFSGCALKRDVDFLDQRLGQLENENRELKQRLRQVDDMIDNRKQSENSIRDLYAGQYAEFDQNREELRRLNGQVDEMSYRMTQEIQAAGNIAQHARDAAASNDNRVRRIERYLGFEGEAPSAETVGLSVKTDAPAPADVTESQAYTAAKQVYDEGDWDEANRRFEAFLKKFPSSQLADNARFWIGEIYYNQGLFKKAIIEYQIVIETYPNSNKVPAAYLKQGISFHSLGENPNARLAMQELIRRFPDSNEAGIARQYMTRLQ